MDLDLKRFSGSPEASTAPRTKPGLRGSSSLALIGNGTFKKNGIVTATYTKMRDEPPCDYAVVVKQHAYDSISLELSVDVDRDDLNDGERATLDWLDRNPDAQFTAKEIRGGTGASEASMKRYLRELCGKQLVIRRDLTTPTGRTVLYSIPGEVDEVGVIKNKIA